ncbi:phage head protein [bacterium (Candidatus Blackallbacteria) CG13_big_fil_rev_8_21_14_2_50_49_14]|nr:MAG: phage head protein [bacterium (Candidatus Blackallbacteria) CG18_big_fil_WC_8_21_14_2_50_49_26]PIW46635.1 MAG: phage head protein [bacterium (Candidatus Blackallbacteria) CG13_big_fil_rev_8_21_14_2_50_49_14]
MPEPSISGVFREPFQEQVAFFRQKLGNQVPTERWTDMQKEAHDRGFIVAGAAKADLLADLAASVDKAISQGTSLDAFRKDFRSIAAKHGWDYRGEFNWRTKVIYQTNMLTSYSAGRLAQLREAGFTHWEYIHSKAVAHPRKQHQAWDGLVLPADDPFWNAHYPPNGWGCQCRVKGKNNPSDIGQAPDVEIDPKTGEPFGIDKGWGYMPGNTVSDTVRAMGEKTVQWDTTIVKAYMENLPEGIKDQFARSYRDLPSTADAARQYAKRVFEKRPNYQEFQTLGLIESKDAQMIRGWTFKETAEELAARNRKRIKHGKPPIENPFEMKNVDIKGFDFALNKSALNHIRDRHGVAGQDVVGEMVNSQKPVEPDDFKIIPEVLNSPDIIENRGATDIGGGTPFLAYKKAIGNQTYVVLFEVLGKKRMLSMKSFFIYQRKS